MTFSIKHNFNWPKNIQNLVVNFVFHAASSSQIMLVCVNVSLHLSRFLSPIAAVPLVALSGFGLYEFGFPVVCNYLFPTKMSLRLLSSTPLCLLPHILLKLYLIHMLLTLNV